MGYEVRLHVGEYHIHENDDYFYFLEIGQIDLCKIGQADLVWEDDPDAVDCYVWASDGNTKLTEDAYGDSIKALPIKKVIKELKKLARKKKPYRRYVIALAMLTAIDSTFTELENVHVAFYGH